MLAGFSEDSDDSEDFDVESEDEDAENRPWRPSHTIFGKSSIKQNQIDAMKGRYFRDMSIVRAIGDNAAPAPEVDEVVVYRSFMKAGLRFPLSKFMVEVLKTFEVFLHQITPRAIIRMGVFIWAVAKDSSQVQNVFAICMSFLTKRRPLGRNNIIIILVVTALCPALM
jgi:hypothetical protein